MQFGDGTIPVLQALCAQYLRPIDHWVGQSDGTMLAVFVPALTTAEQATFADLQKMAAFGITNDISLAEFQAFKSDAANAKAYLSLTSPTNAQTVAALKSVIRVVGALLRS